MDLLTSITTGSGASLTASLILLPAWSFFAKRFGASQTRDSWRAMTVRSEVIYLSWHLFAGAAQGVLFWLSWGFAALEITSWWTHGLIVGFAYSLLLVLPMLGICTAITRINKATAWALITETLLTSVVVGMACSWNWMHLR